MLEKHANIEIPASWQLIATMNVFDKSLLFEMSYALMRRFAFIEVTAPDEDVYRDLISGAADGDAAAREATERLLALRQIKDWHLPESSGVRKRCHGGRATCKSTA